MNFILQFLYSQLFVSLPYPDSDFSGQTVIVTGSNTGLGLEAARHLARLNAATVILAVRTASKGEAAKADIVRTTGADPSRIEVWPLDLSRHASITAFGERVRALPRLDALVQNAGILTQRWERVEGLESHVAVNVVGAVLVALQALPKLRASAAAFGTRGRIDFVGSDLHYVAKFAEQRVPDRKLLDALNDEAIADMADRYKVSKVLLLQATRILAQQSPVTPESNVVINCSTPGACTTDIFRDKASWLNRMAMGVVMRLIARTAEQGSRTCVDAVKPEIGVETHGAFLMDCKVFPNGENIESAQARDTQERLRVELFELLERIQPGVTRF